MKNNNKKLVLIGWDAADWKIINPLLDSGKMPALEKLINNGVMGNISTLEPVYSPILWTSIATGKRADKHGILGFVEPNTNNNGIRQVQSSSRKCKTVWNILNQNNLKSNVIGWWPSYPVEPINGIMLSNNFQKIVNRQTIFPIKKGNVYPEYLSLLFSDLQVNFCDITLSQLKPFIPNIENILDKKNEKIEHLIKTLAETASIHNAFTWTLEHTEWNFTAAYFDAIDHICHGFVQYHPPKLNIISDDDFQDFKDVVNGMYMFHDMMLETVMNMVDNETYIMLVSDHGFHSDHLRSPSMGDHNAAPSDHHREHGIFVAMGPNIKKDEQIYGASLLNVTPTILSIFGLPFAKDMDAPPLLNIFEKVPPLEIIESWETVQGDSAMPQEQENPIESQEEIQHLIDLGYIDNPGEDNIKAAKDAANELQFNLARVFSSSGRLKDALNILEKLYKTNKTEYRYAIQYIKNLLIVDTSTDYDSLINEILSSIQAELSELLAKELDSMSDMQKRRIFGLQLSHQQLLLYYIENLIANNKLEQANKLVYSLFMSKSVSPSAYLLLATIFIKEAKFEDAKKTYNQLLSKVSDSQQALIGLAEIALYEKLYEDAANYALDAIGLNYHLPMAHYYLGLALEGLENYEDASQAYECTLKLRPGFGSARNKLIAVYENKLHNFKKAEEHKAWFHKKSLDSGKSIIDITDFKTIRRQVHEPIFVVSGLPRSGTSAMMQLLDKARMSILSDKMREADVNNPKGYFEYEAVKSLPTNKKWLPEAKGKVVKIIAHLLSHLPAVFNYKIVFMLRDVDEIVESQHTMLVNLGKAKKDVYPSYLREQYLKQLQTSKLWFENNYNTEVLYLHHKDLYNNKLDVINQLNEFFTISLSEADFDEVIDKNLYRSKA